MDPVQSREPMTGFRVPPLSAAAIVIGVFIALVVQIMLALLGAGIGYSAFRGFLYLMLAKKGDGYQWATTNP
jgi:hypothetical protein